MIKSIRSISWIALISLFCWLMIDLTLPYLSFTYDVDFLLTKQKIIHVKHWRYAFNFHILFSIFSLIAGLTQFSQYILAKCKKLHRVMGYIYVVDVMCIAGPSGLIMAFYANGNIVSKTSFVLLSVLWIGFTSIAIIKALKKDFIEHEKWMIRSYALTLSAITLRLLALVLPYFVHLNAKDEYAILAWLSWLMNLLIAEVIIYFKNSNRPS
ncbi:MAG: DUF2306 domain-containing protein [Bacteroidia bacterium]|nr:DUF2306 domain-containing protein [Bacteroidia bacterium]